MVHPAEAVDTPRIATAAVGQVVVEHLREVTFRQTAAYAAALGFEDDVYLDDRRPGGAMAPPPFIVAIDWPLLTDPAWFAAIGLPAERYFDVLMHAFQETAFQRPVRPGDRLRSRLMVAGAARPAPGALVTARIETVDADTGEPVALSWFGALFRGLDLDGKATAVTAPPPLRRSADLEGPAERVEAIRLFRTLPHLYGECAAIWNPAHTERAYAEKIGLPDVIAHGTSVWALAAQAVIRDRLDGDPTRLKRFGARFSRMLLLDQTVRVEHSAQADGGVGFVVRTADGVPAISHGIAGF